MNDNQFDEFFKSKLEKFASDIPDDMWQRVHKQDKDRRGFFILRWYWFAFLLLLFIGAGSYFVLNNNTTTKIDNDVTKNEKANTEKKDESNSAEEILNRGNKRNDSIFANTDNDHTNLKTATAQHTKRSNQAGNTKAAQLPLKKNAVSTSSAQIFDNDYIPFKRQDDKLNNLTHTNNDPADSSNDKNLLTKTLKEDSSEVADDEGKDPGKEDAISDKFFIEFYASPTIPVNSISSNNAAYEQTLKNAGKMQFSYNLGARIGIRINDKWSAKTGLLYTQVNEKMNFTDSVLNSINVSYNNRYKSIDIPFLLSYRTQWQQSFSSAINAGILLNISSRYKGAIPDAYGDTRHLDNSKIYKAGTGASIFLSVDLSKQLQEKMDLFAEPYFSYRIKSITTNLQPFNQKIHAAGVSVGIRYRLFKKSDAH